MKKIIAFIVVLLVGVLLGVFLLKDTPLNNYDYARITELEYTAVVVDEPDSNGKVIITERITFEIHAASKNNLFWELWRDLPEEYIDGVKIEYKVLSVKQVFDDKPDVYYDRSPRLYWEDEDFVYSYGGLGPGKWYHSKGPYDENRRLYECVFFYVNGLYRETVVFEIQYEMYNASLRYNDVSELYLSLYYGDSILFLNSVKGQILIPNELMPQEGNYEVHTYGTNSHSFPFAESTTANPGYYTFSFELDQSQLKFKPYNQYIEFDLLSFGEDKHIFTQHASKNYYYNDDVLAELRSEQTYYDKLPGNAKTMKIIVFIVTSIITLLIGLFTLTKNKRMQKKYKFYTPTMEMEYFRDIPSDLDPCFAASLVFAKHKVSDDINHGYSAVLLSLARKDYIEVEKIRPEKNWDLANEKIVVKYNPTPVVQEILVEGVDVVIDGVPIQGDEQETLIDSSVEQALIIEQDVATDQTVIVEEAIPVNTLEALTPTEQLYFELILRHTKGNEISMTAFQRQVADDYENTDSFVKNVKRAVTRIGIDDKYYQKANFAEPKSNTRAQAIFFIIIALILIIVVNLISRLSRLDLAFGGFTILGLGFLASAVYLYHISKKYILLTQYGEDEYAKWRALYNFLDSETLMNERTIIELPMWEQYLVYATAFGISEKVIKALKIRCPNMADSPVLSNQFYHSHGFRTSGHSFRAATRSASYTARSGAFGGYGGGGRGGGGGGGGH
jgi:Predicted membrane protein